MAGKHIFMALGAGVAFVIGVPALALGLLHTPMGERFVEAQAHAQTDGAITLEGLDVHGLLDVRLARFAMQDIEVEGLALEWSPLALFSRTARIESVQIDVLTLRQSETAPEAEVAETPEPFALPQLPELPVALDVQSLAIAKLVFAAPDLGLEGRYTLAGNVQANRTLSQIEAKLNARRNAGRGALDVDISYGAKRDDIAIKLHFEDDDGAPLAALTGFDGGALTLDLTAAGPISGTDLVLDFDLAKGPAAQANLNIGYTDKLHLTGDVILHPRGLGGVEVADYVGEALTLNLATSLAPGGEVEAVVQSHIIASKLNTQLELRAGGGIGKTMRLAVDGTQTQLADLPAEFGLLELQLRGHLDQVADMLAVDLLRVKADAADISLRGVVPLAAPYSTRMDGTVTLSDLSKIAPDLKGKAHADLWVRGTKPTDPLLLNVDATARLASGTMGLTDITAKVTGQVTPTGVMDVETVLALPNLTPLDPRLKGAMTLNAHLQGTVEALTADAKIRTTQFAFEEAPLTGIAADIKATRVAEAINGIGTLRLLAKGAPLTLATPFAYDGVAASLTGFDLQGPGLRGSGSLSYQLADALGQGRMDVAIADLGKLAALFGQQAAGRGTLALALKADNAKVDADLAGIRSADFGIAIEAASVKLTTRLSDPMGALAGKISAQNIAVAEAIIPALEVDLQAGTAGTAFDVATTVSAPVDLTTQATGLLEMGAATKVRLSTFSGVLDGEVFTLQSPTEVSVGGDTLTLAETVLAVGEGTISLSFTQSVAQVQGRVALAALDLSAQMPNGFPLSVDGVAEISGAANNPAIKVDMRAVAPLEALDETLQIAVTGQVVEGALNAQLALAGAGGDFRSDVAGRINANIRDGVFGVVEGVPLTLRARGDIGLAPFAFFVFDDGSTLAGALRLEADAVLAGAPQTMQGSLCLQNFAVGLVASGTQLTQGAGCFALSPNGAVDGSMTAQDGHGGGLTIALNAGPGTALLSGLTADKAPIIDGKVTLTHLRVIDGDLGVVKVHGAIAGSAALDAALTGKLGGKITVEQGDLVIPANAGPSFTALPVTHIGRPQDAEALVAVADATPMGAALALDIAINVPGQFFVRGRGIESEWRGDVAIKGMAAQPIIGGKISMIKGQATTGAAVLSFNRGVVTLVPDPPALMPIVLIDMVSESKVDGTTARMTLSGPVVSPKISFSSEPTLPEDEILARLLFGKPAAQMTASEALSLAGAALELSGTFGGGVGVLGQVRRGLGVDRLSVDASADDPAASSVSAGKYITPELYLSVKQAADGTAPSVGVEYELTDDITVTGEQEGTGGESVGVRYEYDY